MPNKPLPYHPKSGEVLRCDYCNLVEPEMAKVRWVVVLSPKFLNRPNLCTVIPLSTSAPRKVEKYHVQLENDPAPNSTPGTIVWAKCDMLMTVSFSRLSAFYVGRKDGKRNYVTLEVSGKELGLIKQGALYALGLAHLWK